MGWGIFHEAFVESIEWLRKGFDSIKDDGEDGNQVLKCFMHPELKRGLAGTFQETLGLLGTQNRFGKPTSFSKYKQKRCQRQRRLIGWSEKSQRVLLVCDNVIFASSIREIPFIG